MKGVERVFGSTLSFYLAVAVVLSLLTATFASSIVTQMNIAPDQQRLVTWLVRLSTVGFSLSLVTGTFAVIPPALQRYDISNKLNVLTNIGRTGGFIVLAVSGFGLAHLVLWDVTLGFAVFCAYRATARGLLPGIRLRPSFSLQALREILGYSVFTSFTAAFLALQREGGKFIVGSYMGPTGIAYLGTADNVAYRLYLIVISGVETLMPKFSASRDAPVVRALVVHATWASSGLATVMLVPLAVLMPQLLSVWINPAFSVQSAPAGQYLALGFIALCAYAPAGTFFRGNGKPWLVTAAVASSTIVFCVFSIVFVPRWGVVGVGYAFLLSSLPWLGSLLGGWLYAFGTDSVGSLARAVGGPVLVASGAFLFQTMMRDWWVEPSWLQLACWGAVFASVNAVAVFATDWITGGPSSREVMRWAGGTRSRLAGFAKA